MTRRLTLTLLALGAASGGACRGGADQADSEHRALDFSVGEIRGTVSVGGAPLTERHGVMIQVDASSPLLLDPSGNFVIPDVSPGAHVVRAVWTCGQILAERTAVVSAATTTTVDLDLTDALGRVRASVTSNGASAFGTVDLLLGFCSHDYPINAGFSMLLPPGTYDAQLRIGAITRPFSFSVVAGQTTDLGTIAVEHGSIAGTVFWNGAPVSVPAVTSPSRRISITTPTYPSGDLYDFVGGFSLASIPAGDHVVRVASGSCVLAERTAVVSSGLSTEADMDLTPTVGRLTAALSLDGPGTGAVLELGACGSVPITQGGAVTLLLPTGSYPALPLRDARGTQTLGFVSFDVLAGQTSVVALTQPVGAAQGTVSWGGQPATGNPGRFEVRSSFWSAPVTSAGAYQAQTLLPGTQPLALHDSACSSIPFQTSINVPAGNTATTDIDLTPIMGRVVGTLTFNGQPSFGTFDAAACRFGPDLAGNLSVLLPPGSYAGTATANLGSAPFAFTVVAGQTVDIGNIDTDPQIPGTGVVRGTVSWKGAPLIDLPELSAPEVIVAGGRTRIDQNGAYLIPNVPPGIYPLNVRNDCGYTLAAAIVVVSSGETTTIDLDTTPNVGRVTGVLTINGRPLSQADLVLDSVGAQPFIEEAEELVAFPVQCVLRTDDGGAFSIFLREDSYQATVTRDAFSGSFSFAVLVGQETDINGVTTPAGINVHVDLSGGLSSVGGLSLEFSEVAAAGHTTVIASGDGPAPPAGFQIIGHLGEPRFWDIDSSAAFAGTIEVCLRYDQAWIAGNESLLRLFHDPGGGLVDITTILDEEANVICGTTTSLSPFAIGEPVDAAGPVISGVVPVVNAYATSTNGAKVSYAIPSAVDAVDGARPVTCTPASGSQFPVNRTTVTCTAADASGNGSTAEFDVWVTYQAPTNGSFFLRPLRADGTSIFRIGRAVPVKFELTGASKNITTLVARLMVTKVSNTIRGTAEDVSDEDGEDTDMTFKYRPGKKLYAYRWKTRGETQGTYRLRADLGDGVPHEIDVSLKAPKK